MSTPLKMSVCPNCGAPLDVRPGVHHVICFYCNKSLAVSRPPGVPGAQLTAEAIPAADIERVKALVLDGKREEAIAHYMRAGSVPRDEAKAAVDAMVLSSHAELVRHLPLTAKGIFLSLFLIVAFVGLGALCIFLVRYASIFKIVLAAPIVLGVMRIIAFIRHASATWTATFGAKGNARIVRCGLLRELDADSFLAVVLFEVTPDDGSDPFHDQETVFVGRETLDKLVAGNVIGVRFDGARKHVYMRTPVVVLASGT